MSRRSDTSSQENEIEELRAAVSSAHLARVPGSHHVVVVGPKGGSGTTTTAAILATNLASSRGEIVSVLDATTKIGTLRRRLVSPASPATRSFRELCLRALAGDLAPEWAALAPYVDVVAGLRVLRTLSSPEGVESLSPKEYVAGVALLRRAGQIVVTDLGARANGPVAVAALESASTLVVASEFAYDALELAIEMVSALCGQPLSYRPDPDDWSAVSDGRFTPLVAEAVVVVAPGRRGSGAGHDDKDLAALVEWLRVVCGGGVVLVPRDDHLATGDLIEASEMQLGTRFAHLHVGAAVAARFALAGV